MKNIECEITGTTAMLQHRFPTEDYGANKSKAKKKTYIPEEEAEKALYRSPDGTIHQPSEHILGSLIKAAVNFNYEGKKTFRDVIKAGIVVEPDAIPLLDNDGNIKKMWDEIDARPVVIGRARVICWRPKFNKWKLQFKIQILNDDQLSPETLKEILDYAGRVGIGDYRPRFGRFQVTKWTILNGEAKSASIPTQ